MANNRFYKLNIEKQELILNTALKEFMDLNFELASINKISKKAGLSAGALYYYFEDKEDLFLSTIEYALKDIKISINDLEQLFGKYGFGDGITEIIKRRLEFTLHFPEKMSFIQRLILTKDNVESNSQSEILDTFKMIFDYGYNNGYINKSLPKELMFEVHLGMITSINK
jgi:TetR/AcrR family transcriptional regulator